MQIPNFELIPLRTLVAMTTYVFQQYYIGNSSKIFSSEAANWSWIKFYHNDPDNRQMQIPIFL